MNCKPGDLAVVVRGQMSAGRIVRCIRVLQRGEIVASTGGTDCRVNGDSEWLIEGSVYRRTLPDNTLRSISVADDEWLKPIRDPGEDATDETLTWLPVPSRERETA